MSYVKKVSEEMHIRVVDKTTWLAAKLLGYYIENFYGMYQVSSLDIFDASLTVDGETISMNGFNNLNGKVTHIATRGKNKGKYVPLGSKPSVYYAFRQWARELHEAKDITFNIHYEAYRYLGDDVGIKCMISALESLNCATLRKNVTYKAMEEYDYCQDITLYRFDKDYQGFVDFDSDYSSVSDAEYWEMDFNNEITCGFFDDNGDFHESENVREALEKCIPILEKYGIYYDEYKDGDEFFYLYGFLFVQGNKLEEFVEDFAELNSILNSYGMYLSMRSDHFASKDYGKFSAVHFDRNDNGELAALAFAKL